jgi:hypothetical protein
VKKNGRVVNGWDCTARGKTDGDLSVAVGGDSTVAAINTRRSYEETRRALEI